MRERERERVMMVKLEEKITLGKPCNGCGG
jgi:hypothetical protein